MKKQRIEIHVPQIISKEIDKAFRSVNGKAIAFLDRLEDLYEKETKANKRLELKKVFRTAETFLLDRAAEEQFNELKTNFAIQVNNELNNLTLYEFDNHQKKREEKRRRKNINISHGRLNSEPAHYKLQQKVMSRMENFQEKFGTALKKILQETGYLETFNSLNVGIPKWNRRQIDQNGKFKDHAIKFFKLHNPHLLQTLLSTKK